MYQESLQQVTSNQCRCTVGTSAGYVCRSHGAVAFKTEAHVHRVAVHPFLSLQQLRWTSVPCSCAAILQVQWHSVYACLCNSACVSEYVHARVHVWTCVDMCGHLCTCVGTLVNLAHVTSHKFSTPHLYFYYKLTQCMPQVLLVTS